MRGSRTELRLCATALAVLIGMTAASARSQDNAAAAQALYEDAMTLIKEGNHASACPKLEESQKLDPGMGTQYRLAECYEKTGRLASAWSLYITVADAARQVGRADLESYARGRADALRPKLPKLTILVPKEVESIPGVEIKRDGSVVGRPLWNSGIPLDPGKHTIEATAPKKKPWKGTIEAKEGVESSIAVPALDDLPKAPPSPSREAPGGSSGFGQRAAAVAVGGVGVAGIVVGAVFGSRAVSTWKEVVLHCGDPKDCDKMPGQLEKGRDLESEARTSSTLSTIAFVVGGVGLVAAPVLWFTAPSPKSTTKQASFQLYPTVGMGTLGGVVQGHF